MHVVGSEEIGNARQFMEKSVFKTKEWCWSDNGSLRKDVSDHLFSACLGTVEFGGRVQISAVGRDVNETINIVLSDSLSNALSTFNVDIFEIEVSAYGQHLALIKNTYADLVG